MATRISMTEARVSRLPIPPTGRVTVYDSTVPELALRMTAAGAASWYVVGTLAGRRKWVSLGTRPSVSVDLARELAREALVKLKRKVDPVEERREVARKATETRRGGKAPMVEALQHHMKKLETRARVPAHMREVRMVAERAIAAGVTDLADPRVASVAGTWLESLDVSPLTRCRYATHLIAIGKTALLWWPASVLGREPFAALSGSGAPMPVPPVFTPAESCALVSGEALSHDDDGGLIWAFLLYAGCRYKEAAFAQWDRIDLDQGTFVVIPPNEAEHAAGARVKRNRGRTVTLQRELLEILKLHVGEGFIFPEPWRTRPHCHNLTSFRRHLDRLGIPQNGRHIHSLRHTHACLAIASGEDSMRLRLSMGHAGPEMQAHYANQAMRWRKLLAGWRGDFRLRDPAEAERIATVLGSVAMPDHVACL